MAKRTAPPSPDRDLLETVATNFIERYAKVNTRESSWRETERILKRAMAPDALPRWRGRRVQDIKKRDVIELLDAISDRGSPVKANRTLASIRRMFSWCVERGVLEASPCSGVRTPAPESTRDRVLSDDELKAVWMSCDKIGRPFGPLFQLLILTTQRREEVTGMRWLELDLKAGVWTIPRDRVKNNTEQIVPLAPQAIALLKTLPVIRSKAQFVFTTNGESAVSGHSRAKARLDAELLARARKAAVAVGEDPAAIDPWPRRTLHDLRRTAASGMARLGVQMPVVEKILNHTSGSFGGVAGVYQRHTFAEEKRRALEAWAEHIERLVNAGSECVDE